MTTGALRSASRASPGPGLAIVSALLFGASTPLAKLLLGDLPPLLLAGLLYAGSGCGLWLVRWARPFGRHEAPLSRRDIPWLAGAVALGGVAAPVLLLSGLRATPAAVASLLLNLEGVFTALLAWFVFRENFDRRIALGMLLIVAGGAVLSWQRGPMGAPPLGLAAVAAACLCWALDNNLTQRISGGDPLQVAAIKGSVAGAVNLAAALSAGADIPRAGMAADEHTHEPSEHSHLHVHDEHHRHEHAAATRSAEPHRHAHVHQTLTHSHPHFPDLHHRHRH